jgi:hypothetical protein
VNWWIVAGLAVLILWLCTGRRGPAYTANAPIQPAGDTGSGDRTAQRPKARSWRG